MLFKETPGSPRYRQSCRGALALLALLGGLCATPPTTAETLISGHGYTPFGELKYPADFTHFEYVNPDAPRGGTLKLMAAGTFDSLNPYTLKGKSLANTGAYIYGYLELTDTLLTGADDYHHTGDEPQSAYGLIASSIAYPPSLQWCVFNLRPEARFNDGRPITADDVVFSYSLLKQKGHPRYALLLQNVSGVTKLGDHKVRFDFEGEHHRDLPLLVGQMPVLPKHYWEKRDFAAGTLEPPVISNAYQVAAVKPGRQIVLKRNQNYWGRNLPVNRGRYNFDTVVIDFYRDAQVAFEAFKTGGYDIHLDYIAKHWATAYDFPAMRDGRVRREAIKHSIPQGTQAFFLNLRRPPFNDTRVREALGLLFDFEWTNKTIFNGAYKRQETWFPNSANAASGIPAGRELELLEPFRKPLPEALFTRPFSLPATEGSGHNRENMRKALALLKAAGWETRNQKMVNTATGKPMTLEVVINHNPGMDRVIQPWLRNLAQLGIAANYRSVDPSSYKERMDNFDYDVTVLVLSQSAFPGPELIEYFHSSAADMKGGRNYSGVSDPVVDALVDATLAAHTLDDFRAAIHALDRVLLWRHYVIPHWYLGYHRLAWWDKFGIPQAPSPYNLGTDTWWSKSK